MDDMQKVALQNPRHFYPHDNHSQTSGDLTRLARSTRKDLVFISDVVENERIFDQGKR